MSYVYFAQASGGGIWNERRKTFRHVSAAIGDVADCGAIKIGCSTRLYGLRRIAAGEHVDHAMRLAITATCGIGLELWDRPAHPHVRVA